MFTAEQTEQLLRAINPRRVLHANNQAHVSQQDIRAHLIRVFGFAGWDKEILSLKCIRDEWIELPPKREGDPPRNVPAVTYICRLRLTVWCPTRCHHKISEDVGTGTSPNLPYYGDSHDFASKNAVSYALKRCAIDLGDQFGLSLYNKGQTSALVGRTLVGFRPEDGDTISASVDADVPQQESLGDTEGGGDGGGGAEPVVEPRAELLPDRTASPALRRAYEAAIARYGGVMGFGQPQLRARFASTYGSPIEAANDQELSAYADDLRSEAERLTAHEDPDETDQETG